MQPHSWSITIPAQCPTALKAHIFRLVSGSQRDKTFVRNSYIVLLWIWLYILNLHDNSGSRLTIAMTLIGYQYDGWNKGTSMRVEKTLWLKSPYYCALIWYSKLGGFSNTQKKISIIMGIPIIWEFPCLQKIQKPLLQVCFGFSS